MNRFSITVAAVATAAFSQVALAADMPSKGPAIAPAPVAPSWSGFYIGGDLGGAWMKGQDFAFADPGNAAFATCGPCLLPYSSPGLSGDRDLSVLGGFHVGYNWQFAPAWLLGLEGDFAWTSLKSHASGPLFSDNLVTAPGVIVPVPGSLLSFETEAEWLASLRARLGWIFQPNWMVYATGGVAWGHFKQSANAVCPTITAGGCGFAGTTLGGAPFSNSDTSTGFVVGGGVEWQMPATAFQFIPGRWRARLEYLYYGFDDAGVTGSSLFVDGTGAPVACRLPTVGSACSAQYAFGGNVNIQTVRVGLSYGF
jgi:outer membrane immunogenic protein